MKLINLLIALLSVQGVSLAAENPACSGNPKQMVELSCSPLSEKLLTSLRFATREQVAKAMKAQGSPSAENPDTIHFVGKAKKGETGVLNVTFRDGKAVIVDAFIDQAEGRPLQYLWNADGPVFCSDLPNAATRCND